LAVIRAEWLEACLAGFEIEFIDYDVFDACRYLISLELQFDRLPQGNRSGFDESRLKQG
jgi:hypothetical protein